MEHPHGAPPDPLLAVTQVSALDLPIIPKSKLLEALKAIDLSTMPDETPVLHDDDGDAPGQAAGGSAGLPTPPAPLKMERAMVKEIGLQGLLEQANVGDDEQVLDKAGAWVQAQKPTSVADIVQYNMVDDFVNALDLPIIPKSKLLEALKAMA